MYEYKIDWWWYLLWISVHLSALYRITDGANNIDNKIERMCYSKELAQQYLSLNWRIWIWNGLIRLGASVHTSALQQFQCVFLKDEVEDIEAVLLLLLTAFYEYWTDYFPVDITTYFEENESWTKILTQALHCQLLLHLKGFKR